MLKSGTLSKKAQRTKRWIKHWFVLKNDALSWYQSSSDPYFPHGIVDLRYAVSCDPNGEKSIRLRTNQKTIHLTADSSGSRDEWVKAIRKVIFKAQNMGDSVKIAIPFSTILDVEKSSAMDFSETIEVKVLDKEELLSVDSYFFAYFHDLPDALDKIRDAVRAHKASQSLVNPQANPQIVLDTTLTRPAPAVAPVIDRAQTLAPAEGASRPTSSFRLTSLLRSFGDRSNSTSLIESPSQAEDFTHIQKQSSFIPITTSPKHMDTQLPSSEPGPSLETSTSSITPTPSTMEHTYPPSTPTSENPSVTSSWNVGVPAWLKGSSRRVLGGSAAQATSSTNALGVSEVYSSTSMSSSTGRSGGASSEMGYSVLETPETSVDHEMTEKFRAAFAFGDKEVLLGCELFCRFLKVYITCIVDFTGYTFSLLPVYGRLYVSTNYFCFKSSGPLTTRTRVSDFQCDVRVIVDHTQMMLPIRDILAIQNTKAARFGHHGLIVIVKGYEELFFEFGFEDRRSAFVNLLERQMEVVNGRVISGEAPIASQGKRDAMLLEQFDAKTPHSTESDRPVPEAMADSLPAIMFTSASSTFLTFKPKESLHFTFLTIGSRGDVQPYIALAKPLMADGHRVKIATHGEFKEWIESVSGHPISVLKKETD